jgi:protein-S-isoprenylcysteine O-methyltransferase Ste14
MAWLARFRVALGFAFGALVFWFSTPTFATIAIGSVIAVCGEAIRIWAAGHLQKSREVTASGPYRWVGHPLYVGSSVMGGGLAIACGSLAVAVLIATYLAVALTVAARAEEAFLRRTFGDRYDRYERGVVDVERRFSVAQVIANHEHRAVMGLVVAVLLLALKAARIV